MHAVRVQTTEDAEDLEIALKHDIVGGGPETEVHVLLGATVTACCDCCVLWLHGFVCLKWQGNTEHVNV